MPQKPNIPDTADEHTGTVPQNPDDELEMADDDDEAFEDAEEFVDESEVEEEED